MNSYVFELSDVSIANGDNTLHINNSDSVFGAIPGSMLWIDSYRPRFVQSVDNTARTVTLTANWDGADVVNKPATIAPLPSHEQQKQAVDSVNSVTSAAQNLLTRFLGLEAAYEGYVNDKIIAFNSLIEGAPAFQTLSTLNAFGSPQSNGYDDDILVRVWNDATAENNGTYGWTGSIWKKSAYDLATVLKQTVDEIEEWVSSASPQLIEYESPESEAIQPLIIDAMHNVLLGFKKSTGEPVLAGFDNYAGEDEFIPLMVDADGNHPLVIERATGKLYFDPHPNMQLPRQNIALNLLSIGAGEKRITAHDIKTGQSVFPELVSLSTDDPFAPVIVDGQGQPAAVIEKATGRIIFIPHPTMQLPRQNISLNLLDIGENEKRLTVHDIETGEAAFPEIHSLTSSGDFAPVIVDSRGQPAMVVEKATGRILFDPHPNMQLAGTSPGAMQPGFATDFADYNHIVFYGQSLSIGAQGLPLLSTEQPYNNVTFTGGPRAASDKLTGFKPLVEDDTTAPDGGTNRGETPCSGAANHFTRLIEDENGIAFDASGARMLCSTAGRGGYRIDQLDAGTTWYSLLQAHIQGGYNVSQSLAETYALKAIGWLQGEADASQGTSYVDYYTAFSALRADIQSEYDALMTNAPVVPLFTYQTAFQCATNDSVARAQYDVVESMPHYYMVCPTYHLPFAADKTHLNALGYALIGGYFAQAMKSVLVDGNAWQPLKPSSVIRQGRIIDVHFHVPSPPLVIDDVTLGSVPDHGFSVVSDGTPQTIESITVTAPDRLRIVLSSPPALPVAVRYGLDHASTAISAKINNGTGGQLRDSSTKTTTIAGNDYALPNWAVAFEIQEST